MIQSAIYYGIVLLLLLLSVGLYGLRKHKLSKLSGDKQLSKTLKELKKVKVDYEIELPEDDEEEEEIEPEPLPTDNIKYIVVVKTFADLDSISYNESAFVFPDQYPSEVEGFESLAKAKEKHPEADILLRRDYEVWVSSLEILKAKKPKGV